MCKGKYLILVALILNICSCNYYSDTEWEFIVKNENEVFPSAIIALSAYDIKDSTNIKNDRKYADIRSVLNLMDISIRTQKKGTTVKLTLKETDYWYQSSIKKHFKSEGEYVVTPEILWKYDNLRKIEEPKQVYAILSLEVNGKPIDEKSEFFTLRGINECLYAYRSNSQLHVMRYLFAAYVNEDKAELQQILKEGIEHGYVTRYTGYQLNSEIKVQKQVASIWNALQNRGIHYSNLTESSHSSKVNISQRVRSLQETLEYGQANCVDGTVLLASLLKQIGIEPILIHIPNHMFLGYYSSKSHKKIECLETTMLERTDTLTNIADFKLKQKHSYASFLKATASANEKYNRYKNSNKIELIEIREVRKFIQPIGL